MSGTDAERASYWEAECHKARNAAFGIADVNDAARAVRMQSEPLWQSFAAAFIVFAAIVALAVL